MRLLPDLVFDKNKVSIQSSYTLNGSRIVKYKTKELKRLTRAN